MNSASCEMKKLNLNAVFTAFAMIFVSCGETKISEVNDAGYNSVSESQSNGVKVEYFSDDAINTPKYAPDNKWGSPLALGDGMTHSMAGFPIVDIGAYPDGYKMVYDILLVNQSTDTVTVSSVKVPGSYMRIDWHGAKTYYPGMLSGFKLVCDSGVTFDDYRFVLTYEGNKYPSQVFHVNLRPDILTMIAERDANNQ